MEVPALRSAGHNAKEVRCFKCGSLLAKRNGPEGIEVRWKELWLSIEGRAMIRCRKCGAVREVEPPPKGIPATMGGE